MQRSSAHHRYLRLYYRQFSDAAMAEALGWERKEVEAARKELGLVRTRAEKTRVKVGAKVEAPPLELAGQIARPEGRFGLDRTHILTAYVVAMAALLVYVLTLGRTVTGEDSGELITAAYTLGIAHPPGYPLWTLLGKLFTYLPFGTVAWRVNFMSAVFAAAAVFLMAVLVMKLTRNRTAGAVSGLAFAFSAEFWEQSVIAEVYSLNALLFAACLALLYHWYEWRRPWAMYAFAFVYGLGCCNHQTMWLLGPIFIGFPLYIDRRPWFRWPMYLAMAGLSALALSTYLYLPIRSAMDPPTDWGNPETWANFWDVVRLKQYAFMFDEQPRTVGLFFQQLWAFVTLYAWEFTPWAAWLPLVGLWALWKREKVVFTLFGVLLALLTVGLIVLRNFELDKEGLWVSNVFWIPAYMLCAVLMGLAVHWLMRQDWQGRNLRPVAITLGLVAIMSPLIMHYERNDKSDYYWSYDYASNVLKTLEPNAIYFPTADHATFPVMYLQAVEGQRPDVTIANKYGYPDPAIYADMPEEMTKSFRKIPAEREALLIEDWVIANTDRPVYFSKKRGIQSPQGARMENVGLLYRVVKPEEDWTAPEDIWERYTWRTLEPEKAKGELTAEFILSDYYFARGRDYLAKADTEQGLQAFHTALSVSGETKETLNNLGSACAEHGAYDAAVHFFAKSLELEPEYELGLRNLAKVLMETEQYAQAAKVLGEMIRLGPQNRDAYLMRATCFEEMNRPDRAIAELETALQFAPQDAAIYRRIGMVYLNQKKDGANALRYLTQSLSLDPNQPDLAMLINRSVQPDSLRPSTPGLPQ